jgi:hypothetical protein
MKRLLLAAAGLAALAFTFGTARPAYASMDIQKKAKAAGVEVAGCVTCHVDKLPKKDAHTLNERGTWLVAEKDKRKAKEVDPAWLKDYVEPKK